MGRVSVAIKGEAVLLSYNKLLVRTIAWASVFGGRILSG